MLKTTINLIPEEAKKIISTIILDGKWKSPLITEEPLKGNTVLYLKEQGFSVDLKISQGKNYFTEEPYTWYGYIIK